MRPAFHFTPTKNWLNDPNGLCQVDGIYHMYFQYNPHGPQWGDIHWGHAVSTDLMHWQERPVAMTPVLEKGEIHCYSGGCCKDAQGKPHFFYTSIGKGQDGRDAQTGAQQWYAAPTDESLDFLQQTDENCLTADVHGDLPVTQWRDPYVIPWKDGYLMVLGGMVEDRGCVLAYTSPDMRHWTYRRILVQAQVADGRSYECPNLFQLDGKMVLLYSPCAAVEVQVGTLDDELTFRAETKEVLDPGSHSGFYAPQVFMDEKGRTILQGWCPEDDGPDAYREGQRVYCGAMNLPRVLSVRDGYLHAEPVPELMDMLAPGEPVDRSFVVKLRCKPDALPLTMTVLASPDGSERTALTLGRDGVMTLDRSRSTLREGPCKTPISRTVRLGETIDLFLAVDGTCIECCVNGQWLSGRAYPVSTDCGGFTLSAAGRVKSDTYILKK